MGPSEAGRLSPRRHGARGARRRRPVPFCLVLAIGALGLLCACGEPAPLGDAPPAEGGRSYPAWVWADHPIAWRSWEADAFALARERGLHVLLYLAAPGCEGLFSTDEPVVQSLAEERFVPVRVDPYRRPEVARRYASAGWPALAVIDPAGRCVTAAVDPPADRVRLLLARMHHHLDRRPEVVADRVSEARAAAAPGRARGGDWTAAQALAAIAAAHDVEHGGFGRGGKTGEWPVLLFLLDWHEARGDSASLAMVEASLDGLLAGPMWDAGAGGVLSLSYTPDWRTPHWEKDGVDQAGLLEVLSRLPALDAERRRVAAQVVAYVRDELLDPAAGLFRGRQVGSPGGPWWTDPAAYVDRQALLVDALLAVAPKLTGEAAAEARRLGLIGAETLATSFVDEGGRVTRWIDGEGAGLVSTLLRDQILVARALLAAAGSGGPVRCRDGARQVLARLEQRQWDKARGHYRVDLGCGLEGLNPPVQDVAVAGPGLDGVLPDGNALAALIAALPGQREGRRDMLLRARPAGPPGRAHATWARALLAHTRSETGAR